MDQTEFENKLRQFDLDRQKLLLNQSNEKHILEKINTLRWCLESSIPSMESIGGGAEQKRTQTFDDLELDIIKEKIISLVEKL